MILLYMQVVVAVDQVAWKAAVGRLAEARSIGPELSVPRDSRASAPQTGDPYRHMEVTIRKGPLKLHRGAVVGSFVGADMNTMVSVRTYTQAVNTTLPFNLEDLVETGYAIIILSFCVKEKNLT
jgi:hypothetical protein